MKEERTVVSAGPGTESEVSPPLSLGLPDKKSMECENWDIMVFDGVRARVALGYLPFEIASSVRS
eukprot:5767248-Lingulodinium_polyedra.AAC.1